MPTASGAAVDKPAWTGTAARGPEGDWAAGSACAKTCDTRPRTRTTDWTKRLKDISISQKGRGTLAAGIIVKLPQERSQAPFQQSPLLCLARRTDTRDTGWRVGPTTRSDHEIPPTRKRGQAPFLRGGRRAGSLTIGRARCSYGSCEADTPSHRRIDGHRRVAERVGRALLLPPRAGPAWLISGVSRLLPRSERLRHPRHPDCGVLLSHRGRPTRRDADGRRAVRAAAARSGARSRVCRAAREFSRRHNSHRSVSPSAHAPPLIAPDGGGLSSASEQSSFPGTS